MSIIPLAFAVECTVWFNNFGCENERVEYEGHDTWPSNLTNWR